MTQALPGITPADIIAEIDAAKGRLSAAPIVDQKAEFIDCVYPILRLLAESVGERTDVLLDRVDGVELTIAEYLMGQESMILPELATTLHTALGLGMRLCDAVDNMFAATHAQIREQLGPDAPPEMFEVPKDIGVLLVAYRQTATDAVSMVTDVTAEPGDDDPEVDVRDVRDVVDRDLDPEETTDA